MSVVFPEVQATHPMQLQTPRRRAAPFCDRGGKPCRAAFLGVGGTEASLGDHGETGKATAALPTAPREFRKSVGMVLWLGVSTL